MSVLDPSCGSGNFLYVALLRLKDLEKEAILFGNDNGLGAFLPMVGPWQLHGIEINAYAHDLAQMVVWIGWLQWIRANGFGFPADPILRPLSDNIRLMDGMKVATINANLTATADTGLAKPLCSNAKISFLGNCKGGPFDISDSEAIELLASAGNPTSQPNSDVIRPVVNTEDLVQAGAPRWIVDSSDLAMVAFAFYEMPYRLAEQRVCQRHRAGGTTAICR